jgi:hypothetical protein
MKLELKLAAHDPDRSATTDGLDNPDCTNGMRADWAAKALEVFQRACQMEGEDADVAAADLICDLLHHVHGQGYDPEEVLENGLRHFEAEAGEVAVILPA